MLEKKESIPIQNTHDLLVGTLSIGIPSLSLKPTLFLTLTLPKQQLLICQFLWHSY